jgi:hypothetical protein
MARQLIAGITPSVGGEIRSLKPLAVAAFNGRNFLNMPAKLSDVLKSNRVHLAAVAAAMGGRTYTTVYKIPFSDVDSNRDGEYELNGPVLHAGRVEGMLDVGEIASTAVDCVTIAQWTLYVHNSRAQSVERRLVTAGARNGLLDWQPGAFRNNVDRQVAYPDLTVPDAPDLDQCEVLRRALPAQLAPVGANVDEPFMAWVGNGLATNHRCERTGGTMVQTPWDYAMGSSDQTIDLPGVTGNIANDIATNPFLKSFTMLTTVVPAVRTDLQQQVTGEKEEEKTGAVLKQEAELDNAARNLQTNARQPEGVLQADGAGGNAGYEARIKEMEKSMADMAAMMHRFMAMVDNQVQQPTQPGQLQGAPKPDGSSS